MLLDGRIPRPFTDAEVRFVSDELRTQEESGSVSVCLESGVMGGFETTLTVSLSAQDGTACEIPYNSPLFTLTRNLICSHL